ncbi:MAG: HlyD family secretion protein [Bacteroidales bacterium]|nr:HlyD family secretion protein [Bacteroidales bacterium]
MNKKQKKLAYNIFIFTLIAVGLVFVISRFVHIGADAYTDDAVVKRQIIPLNSRVAGFVREIRFSDFQKVKKGDTLLIIEDAEYLLRLAQAQANLSSASSGKNISSSLISAAKNSINVSDATLDEVKSQLDNARLRYERYKNLLAQNAVTKQMFDEAEASYKSLTARYNQMISAKENSSLNLNQQNQRLSQSLSGVESASAELDLAKLNLSYTVITAPCDGYTSRKSVETGQFLQVGQTAVSIVSADEVWVEAAFREAQMKAVKQGSRAEIKVDALGNKKFYGTVEAISYATGSAYSPNNSNHAAGNFVKVEQRVPVKIVFSSENSKEDLEMLRSGFNVECSIIK